jgi:phosphoribosyl-dephospho-CoA transferase
VLRAVPWVVVRRAPRSTDGLLPVGVRGRSRAERVAAWLPADAVAQRLRPEQLPDCLPLLSDHRIADIPALAVLGRLRDALAPFGLPWGPGGSVGFELASGHPAARPDSDLDLVIRAQTPLPRAAAARLTRALAGLPVRVDPQLETPHGALSLIEYARGDGAVLLRTVNGPRLTLEPWAP